MTEYPPHPARRQRRPDVVRAGDELGRRRRSHGRHRRGHPPAPGRAVQDRRVHLNYASGSRSSMTTLPAGTDLLPQADLGAERPRRCRRPARAVQVAQLRGRDRHRHRPDRAQRLARTRPATTSRGYTIANDYGLHDFRDTDAGSMLRVKGSDTLCPLGPGLVDDWDFHDKRIRTLVNGEVRQDGNTDRDEVGHALPRRRHRPDHHAVTRATCSSRGRRQRRARSTRATSSRSRSRASAPCGTTSSPVRSRSVSDCRRPADRKRRSAFDRAGRRLGAPRPTCAAALRSDRSWRPADDD